MSPTAVSGTGAEVDFKLLLGQLTDSLSKLDQIHKWTKANPVQTPILRPVLGAYVAAGAALTYGFMDCGGPPAGWRREIRWFTVWGADPFTATTGNIVPLILGPGQYQDSNTEPAGFTQVLTVSTVIPQHFSAAHNEVTLEFPQHLFIMLKGLGNNVAVNCFGQAWDYDVNTRLSEPVG